MARSSKKSFVTRSVSKIAEIRNILSEVKILTAEKTSLQLNAAINSETIIEKNNKILEKTKIIENKVKRSEEKVNTIVVKKIEEKVLTSLVASSDEDYGPVSSLYNKQISFNGSIYYNHDGNIDNFSHFFGPRAVDAYWSYRFLIFKGQTAVDFLRISFQFENTTDPRGYYKIYNTNGVLSGGEYRKNYPKYKKNDIWILYDNLNDIVYYNNYTGNNFPTKKWYRADILNKISIELKIKTIVSSGASGSGSGSGGSGGSSDGIGNSIGTALVDQFLGGSGSDGSSGGNSIGTDLVDQFLGGSDGSSGGNSIGTDLVE